MIFRAAVDVDLMAGQQGLCFGYCDDPPANGEEDWVGALLVKAESGEAARILIGEFLEIYAVGWVLDSLVEVEDMKEEWPMDYSVMMHRDRFGALDAGKVVVGWGL